MPTASWSETCTSNAYSCSQLRTERSVGFSGLLSVQIYSHLERQIVAGQQDGFPSVQSLSHLGQDDASRTSCDGVADSQVCKNIHTWNVKSLSVSKMVFQVCRVYHTWDRMMPAGRAAMGSRTPKCAKTFTPGTLNHCPSARMFSKCAENVKSLSSSTAFSTAAVCKRHQKLFSRLNQ